MIHPDDAHCYPVCQSCEVADVCHLGPIPKPKPSPNAGWAPNQLPAERLKCGCTQMPWPAIRALGEMADSILCDSHGWVKLARKKTVRKRGSRPEVPGQESMVPF